MNDLEEILKRQFWDKIKPPESYEKKTLSACCVYVSSTNPTPPQTRNIDGWTFLGCSQELDVIIYRENERYFEFNFSKSDDLIEELFILRGYSVLLVCVNRLNGKVLHFFNSNNEFYIINDRFYFKGFPYTDAGALFTMTFFS